MEELNRFRKFLSEGTWGYGSKDQMIKALQILDKLRDMGGVKGSVALDKYDRMLYNVFGDDTFHDAIDRAKDQATDDDRFRNSLGDAMDRGREMLKFHDRVDEIDRFSPAAIAARPITRAKFKIGDKVTFKGGGDVLTVTDMRKMFASDLIAYTVRFPDGETAEYDETQLVEA